MTLSDSQIRQAEKRMQARMKSTARAISARYDRRGSRIVVSLDNGLELAFPPRLAGAKPADLAVMEISPTGLGVYWPRLDADLNLPALMSGVFGSRRWMAGLLGAAGGQSKSPAKKSAARTNGRLGGRPRKAAAA